MEAGDADVFFTPELKDKATIDGSANLKSVPSLMNDSGYILYLNNNRFPMNDQNIRLAAQYALDRDTYFQAFLSGLGKRTPAPGPKHTGRTIRSTTLLSITIWTRPGNI